MKFSTYTPAVKPNTINARVNTSVIKEAFGDGGANLGAWGAAAKQIAGVVLKKQDEDDAADIMAARNEISQKVNAGLYGENGIITTGKGKNAVGMTDRINQLINDSTNEVAENYNGRVRYQLQNKYMPQDLEQFGKLGMQTENRERDAYQTDVFNARMETLGNDAAMAYADPETAYTHIGEAEETLNSWAEKQGWDPMTLQNKQMENRTRMVASMVKAAVADEKYDVADKYLERERKNMDADTYSQLHASIDKQQKAKQTKDYSRSILEQCYNSQTNEIDVEKAQKMAREYSTTKGSTISSESVEKGYQKWAGQRMPNGVNGCVEAAVRILGTDSNNPWIQSIQGDTYVPTLVSKAQSENGGPGVIPFSADQVEPGDMIIYDGDSHVVVATGGTGYVGNSSSRQQVVKRDDYRQMDGMVPTSIIKSSHLGDSVGSFDADKYDAIMSDVYSGYADQARFWKIDNNQKVRDLENQLAGMESFSDMRAAVASSGLDAKTQADFNRKIATAEKQAIRAASSGSGSSGGGGMTSQQKAANNYFGSLTEAEDLAIIDEYNERLKDPNDTISPSEQRTRYNKASRRYNFYHGTGTADLNNKDVLAVINEYKNMGYSREQIYEGLGNSMSGESKDYYLNFAF